MDCKHVLPSWIISIMLIPLLIYTVLSIKSIFIIIYEMIRSGGFILERSHDHYHNTQLSHLAPVKP